MSSEANSSIDLNSNVPTGGEFAAPRRREAVSPLRPRPPPDAVTTTNNNAVPSNNKTIPRPPPRPASALPITPPQSPRATVAQPNAMPPPQMPSLSAEAPQTPPKEAPRATARIISQAPGEDYQLPENTTTSNTTYDSPSRASRPIDEQFRSSAPPPKTYYSPQTRSTQSPMRSSAQSQSVSSRHSRYDSSPFKSMRSSPMKYDRSPAKSVRGPSRSAMSTSGRSVHSLPAAPPMPFSRRHVVCVRIRISLEEMEADKSNMRTWFILLALGVLLLLAIAGTVMGFAIRQANQKEEPAPVAVVVPVPTTPSVAPVQATLAPVAAPVAPPVIESVPTNSPISPAPTVLSTSLATENDGFVAQFPDVYTRLAVFYTNDKGASIRVEGTPQNSAYLWLEEDIGLRKVEPVLDAQMAQRYALAVFYFSTNGGSWTRGENWLSPSDECLWQSDALDGTSCNGKVNLRGISQLVFEKNNIGGTLPAELSILTNLEVLSIINDPTAGMKMTGSIPSELGKLTTIREFVLKNHDMNNGTIPASLFLEWPRATLVLMERCKLMGKIPTTIGLLTSATKVSFRKNDLSGTIPTEVGDLRKMLQLSVDANRLTGTIPTEVGLMTVAKGVWVNSNNLRGPIPNEFGNLKQIKAGLRFSDNELTGAIPASLGALTDMKNFELQNNLLTGPVPDFGALSNLSLLNIRDNALTGAVSDATCAAIVAAGTEAYADCPGEVACACCLNCPASVQLLQNSTLRGRMMR